MTNCTNKSSDMTTRDHLTKLKSRRRKELRMLHSKALRTEKQDCVVLNNRDQQRKAYQVIHHSITYRYHSTILRPLMRVMLGLEDPV